MRQTRIIYHIDKTHWLFSPESERTRNTMACLEAIPGSPLCSEPTGTQRTFDPLTGNVLTETNNGKTTQFSYHPNGDVYTVTDPMQKESRYENYFRGQPREEYHPEGRILRRVVNTSGTIARETNGRNFPPPINMTCSIAS